MNRKEELGLELGWDRLLEVKGTMDKGYNPFHIIQQWCVVVCKKVHKRVIYEFLAA